MDELDAIADRVRRRESGAPLGPWTLEVYPTLACNLSCGFCDSTVRHQRPRGELSAARLLRLVDEAADLGARRLMVLGGGEPLLAPHCVDVMRRGKARGLQGMLTTNGTLLGAEVAATLVEIGWDEVHVSVDGARPQTHDRLRGHPGAFARTIRNLCRLRGARDQAGRGPRLALHTVLTRENVDELAAIVRLAAAVGAEAVELDALVAYRPEQRIHALGAAEAERLPERLREGLAEAERLGVRTTYARLLDPRALRRGEGGALVETAGGEARNPEGGLSRVATVATQMHGVATTHGRVVSGSMIGIAAPTASAAPDPLSAAPCLKAWHHLTVQADGRVAPCCVLAGEGGSVAERSLAEVWGLDPFLASVRAGMRAGRPPGRCAECSENLLAHERAIRARLPEVAA